MKVYAQVRSLGWASDDFLFFFLNLNDVPIVLLGYASLPFLDVLYPLTSYYYSVV